MENKILAIDDEEFIRELVHDFLEIEGLNSDTASNLNEAVIFLNENNYNLVLLDRNLEDKSVEEVITAIREIRPEISIVIMTGDLDVPDDFRTKYKISSVIHKPFQFDDFIETVKAFL